MSTVIQTVYKPFFFLLHPKVFVSRTGASIHIREYQAFSDGQFEESCQMQR